MPEDMYLFNRYKCPKNNISEFMLHCDIVNCEWAIFLPNQRNHDTSYCPY